MSLLLLAAVAVFLADQWAKAAVAARLAEGQAWGPGRLKIIRHVPGSGRSSADVARALLAAAGRLQRLVVSHRCGPFARGVEAGDSRNPPASPQRGLGPQPNERAVSNLAPPLSKGGQGGCGASWNRLGSGSADACSPRDEDAPAPCRPEPAESRAGLIAAWVAALAGAGIVVSTGVCFRHPAAQAALGAAVGGAAGNLCDRLRGRSIVDFIDLGWWPAFNLADAAIVAGGILALCLL